ncbi:MAG: hypothetical protein K940chlam3_01347 [Chlamydiae bacterium]|nr:hypothetical protein [Chlamydiota bacterium]
MSHNALELEISRLESINDHLKTEITYIDDLLRLSGFSRGLESLKEVAMEMIEHPEFEEDEL